MLDQANVKLTQIMSTQVQLTHIQLTPPHFARGQMSPGNIGIQLNAIAGLVLDSKVTVLPEWTFANDQIGPPVDPVSQLMNAELAHGRGGVAGSDGSHRARGVVARGPNVVQVGEIGDLL